MSVAGCAGGSKTAQTSAAATQAEAAETSEETADAKEPGTEETSSEETTSVQVAPFFPVMRFRSSLARRLILHPSPELPTLNL